jgi:3-deoxy-D-manno-octulosonic-acid transferase
MVLQAFRLHQGAASLVIVPRHPARAGDIQTLAAAEGFQARLRSRGEPFGGTDVYIADTLGELGLWFALARGALIGGGLVPGPGGHNPIEAAQLGCPILTGPHVDNWRAVYADLMAADAAVTVRSAEALAAAFARLLADHEAARAQADRARHVVAIDRAALNLAVEALISLAP